MKEKIKDFFNGIFAYDQPAIRIEPAELVLELEPWETAQGSFVVSSRDERRIKGLYIPGFPVWFCAETAFLPEL